MKFTNGEIFMAKEPLQKLMEQKFPVKVAYGLAKLSNKLNDQFKVIDEVRNGLIKTYGEVDPENPRQITVKPESEGFQKFADEMDELFAQEVEVVFEKVKLPQEVDGNQLQLEPNILMALEKFIEVE